MAGDLAILDSGEAEGRAYVVTARVESFKGFAEWLNSPFGLPPAAAVNDPLLPSNPSFADLFSSPLQATELLSRSAPPPKKKRDYQPPFPPQPSPYSQIIKRPNAVSLTATAAVEPAESSPPNVDVTAQPVLVAILEERLRLWRILTFTGFGLSAILIVVVFVALLRMC